MKYDIINPYAEALILRRPVCEHPFSRDALLTQLKEAARKLFLQEQGSEYTRTMIQIRLFHRFLEFTGIKEAIPDEVLLEEFRSSSHKNFTNQEGLPYGRNTLNAATDGIRRLFNDYFYPHGMIKRPLTTKKAYLKYKRFLALTELSQKLIIAFETDGRCVSSQRKYCEDSKTGREVSRLRFERKSKRLSDYNRKVYIEKVLTLLGVVGSEGIEQLTQEDLERILQIYRKKEKEDTGRAYLAALYSIIANGVALGFLKKSPFDDFPLERRKRKAREDFVLPDQMEKLLNLDSLEWDNPDTVRKRCVTILIYDTGLRLSAIPQLLEGDVKEAAGGGLQLTVKGSLLKGEKGDKTFHFLFQETLSLLRHWLHVARPKFKPATNRLFVSLQGKALKKTGIRDIVYDCCKELGIHTAKGRIPSPHTLRHTLATLNTEPHGKSVPPLLMQQRLVHVDLETFYRNYVHNNPLTEIEDYKKLLEKGSGKSLLEKIPRQDFFGLLDSLRFATSASIRAVKRAYEREIEELTSKRKKGGTQRAIAEAKALKLLAPFRIDYRSLRIWGLRNGTCRIETENMRKRYLYDELSILEVSKNYIGTDEGLKKFHGRKSTFYKRLKRCRMIKIGRKSLVLKDDFLRYCVGGPCQVRIRSSKYPRGLSEYPVVARVD